MQYVRKVSNIIQQLTVQRVSTDPVLIPYMSCTDLVLTGSLCLLQTLQTNRGADSVRRLRTVLRTHGNSLPLRFQTLEILQLVDKYVCSNSDYLSSKNRLNKTSDYKIPIKLVALKSPIISY